MKIVLILVGILAGLFTIGQILLLLGFMGQSSGIAGIALVLLGAAVTVVCFKKALGPANN